MRSVFRVMLRAVCGRFAMLIFCSALLGAGALHAQSYMPPIKPKNLCLGFDVSFGTRVFQVQSNVTAIDKLNVLEEGGTAGIVFGNNVGQVKLRQGYFYSASSVRYTTDLVETCIEVNINPSQLGGSVFRQVEPYLLAGLTRDAVKFHGHYLDVSRGMGMHEDGGSQKPNYSRSEMPYLGRVVSARLEGGLGMQYHIKVMDSFLRLYGEVRYGYALASAGAQQFENTTTPHQLSFSLGTSFGWRL